MRFISLAVGVVATASLATASLALANPCRPTKPSSSVSSVSSVSSISSSSAGPSSASPSPSAAATPLSSFLLESYSDTIPALNGKYLYEIDEDGSVGMSTSLASSCSLEAGDNYLVCGSNYIVMGSTVGTQVYSASWATVLSESLNCYQCSAAYEGAALSCSFTDFPTYKLYQATSGTDDALYVFDSTNTGSVTGYVEIQLIVQTL
ncbi:hypothetical protein SEUCBS139899_010279 [Sporothrix eucalyptigena]|uniref:Uncharacterized protein n=1 Tax=Sporothrix eucalyptigena TaxID=1812306 RepID=A0ABP0CR79_9PEZI